MTAIEVFSGKEKDRIFEALFQQDNDIVQMRYMAHLICLINLCQTMTRKSFDFLFLTTSLIAKVYMW